MKKFKAMAVVCAAALAASLAFTGCGKSDAGRYDLYSMTSDGETITMKEMEDMYKEMDQKAPEMYLELNEDGTGKLVMGDEDTEELEWKDGVITADGDDIEYTIEDGKLTMEDDGTKMVFEKAE
ncbi:MAG: hypothetical protein ACI4JW_06955 [Oscillospiraceae bacterium]